MLIVQKFGGSSLDGPDRLRRSAEIVSALWAQGHSTAVVVSAMGESTDSLVSMARELDGCPSPREMDMLLSSGEQQSAALMAMTLKGMGLEAMSLTGWQSGILTNSIHGDAAIEQTLPWRVQKALRRGICPVVTGFQGVDIEGDITTLGRGGSDTSAVALAAALKADSCRIYSDVAGVYTADPRLIKDARHIERMDLGDMLILAHSGSQLMHSKSVSMAMEEGVEPELFSSFGEDGMSRLCRMDYDSRPDYAGVTCDRERSQLTLAGKACSPQTLRDMAAILRDNGLDALGGRAGEGFAWLKLRPEQLIYGLELIHEAYFG